MMMRPGRSQRLGFGGRMRLGDSRRSPRLLIVGVGPTKRDLRPGNGVATL
jgi:hypothetical protein